MLNRVIMIIMMAFAIVGAIDRIRGNPKGYGEAFEKGFHAMGSLALAVAAIYAASPILARILKPLAGVLCESFGADAGILPGILFASDMGGYALSCEMASSKAMANFGGLILGTTIGSTWVFSIPVALSIIQKEDQKFLAAGLLCGILTMPLGCFVGGCCMAMTPYALPVKEILVNILPVLFLAVLVGAGLWFLPRVMIRAFQILGRAITILVTLLTVIAAFQQVTGIYIPFFDQMVTADEAGLTGLDRGLLLCGQIALVLAGAFPMVCYVTKHFSSALKKLGKRIGVNTASSAGFLASVANIIPMYAGMKDMDHKGKVLNAAFAAGGAFVLGDYLGFTAGVDSQMVLPVIAAKLTCGISAVVVAYFLFPILEKRIME